MLTREDWTGHGSVGDCRLSNGTTYEVMGAAATRSATMSTTPQRTNPSIRVNSTISVVVGGDISELKLFKSQQAWAAWLDKSHAQSTGLWLRLAKKGATFASVSYQDALEVALCYGWIDGQKQPESPESWLQRFLPRSNRSLWSKINREKASALIAGGQMQPAGLVAIENAKQNGRWESAYEAPRTSTVPPDFAAALQTNPRALAFFDALDRANRYAILWRIQTVKRPETRARKVKQFLAMLAKGEKIHK